MRNATVEHDRLVIILTNTVKSLLLVHSFSQMHQKIDKVMIVNGQLLATL